MRISETVTFGTAALDRKSDWRADPSRIAGCLANPAACAIAIWRGKPLIEGAEEYQLARLPVDHPIFGLADEAPTFLGLDGAVPVFAYDVSGWQPAEEPDTLGAFHDPSEQRHPALPASHRFAELRSIMVRLSAADAAIAAGAKAILGWHEIHGFCARCGAPTAVSMAGWQRDCDNCAGRHFPRTDPVVIMLITHGNDVLLGRSPAWPEAMYSLLAGFVEPGETVETAVRREVLEETAIGVGQVGYLASQPWPFPSSLMLGCWGSALGREMTLDEKEIEDARWVSRETLLAAFAGDDPSLRPARKGSIANFLLRNWLADRLDLPHH